MPSSGVIRKFKISKKVCLARLTTEEDKAWNFAFAFEYYGNIPSGKLSNQEISERAWKHIQAQFPRLKKFDGARP
jgi:hypothetical protein